MWLKMNFIPREPFAGQFNQVVVEVASPSF